MSMSDCNNNGIAGTLASLDLGTIWLKKRPVFKGETGLAACADVRVSNSELSLYT
jgi:hypothetical protein